jgi:hypothetical protein
MDISDSPGWCYAYVKMAEQLAGVAQTTVP